MATDPQAAVSPVKSWLRDTILYNKSDIEQLLKQLVIISVCASIIAIAWNVGWDRGLFWHLTAILEAVIPGPTGPAYIVPAGFFLGLVSVFWLDAYKRLQGLLLLGAGLLAVGLIIVRFDRFQITLTFGTIGLGIIAFILGLVWGGLPEWFFTNETPKMKDGFRRLRWVVGIVGGLGIIEATIDYEPPIVLASGDGITIAGVGIPMNIAFPEFLGFVNNSLFSSPPALVLYLVALAGLLVTLQDFTEYELDKDILILGPDRAGKTWLMAGAGYCLRQRAIGDATFDKPKLNRSLQPYHDIFDSGDFDHPDLRTNDPDEFDFFSFGFDHGVLPKRRVRVKTIDYAGEFISDIDLADPWKEFNDNWEDKDGVDSDSLPSFDTLEDLNSNGNISGGDIPSLLSVMIEEYDAIALVTPGDEFAGNLQDSDLPSYLTQQKVQGQRSARQAPRNAASSSPKPGYFEIYERLFEKYDWKDIFFIVTKSDMFLETYNIDLGIPHVDPKGHPNWEYFREHVLDHIKKEDERDTVHFLSEPPATNVNQYYPVYFEPDPTDPETPGGNFKPKLDWDDNYYPLRGLEHLLKRMGR